MATPAEHRTTAEAFFARVTDTTRTEPTESERRRVEVHAILATKAGTGTHYAAAEAALATAGDLFLPLHVAKLHAILAEPAA